VEKALVANLALTRERDTAFVWFNLVTGLAVLSASFLIGWLMQGFGAAAAFSVAATLALLAAGLLAVMPRMCQAKPLRLSVCYLNRLTRPVPALDKQHQADPLDEELTREVHPHVHRTLLGGAQIITAATPLWKHLAPLVGPFARAPCFCNSTPRQLVQRPHDVVE